MLKLLHLTNDKGLFYPFGITCAEIIACNGLSALADTLKGEHCKLHYAGENRHCSNGHVSAVFLERGVKANRNKAFACGHYEH